MALSSVYQIYLINSLMLRTMVIRHKVRCQFGKVFFRYDRNSAKTPFSLSIVWSLIREKLRQQFGKQQMGLIVRSAEGNLRLCRNLCLGSLIEAARQTQKVVTITHVNSVLVQPHWRSHEQLIQQQAAWAVATELGETAAGAAEEQPAKG